MQIGIGLPNAVLGATGRGLIEWSRRAEAAGFAGLATIDRVAYPNFDSLTTLAAAAAVTERIGLITNVLLGPVYPAALLAKSTASVAALSDGRFTLGVGVGGRPDDFAAAGVDFHTRGRALDDTLRLLDAAWQSYAVADSTKPIVPPVGTVPVLIGGTAEASLQRVVRHGAGWTAGGMPPSAIGAQIEKVRAAWRDGGRTDEPRIAALVYYSLGADAEQASRDNLGDYYAFLGDYTATIVDSALRSERAIRDAVAAYADAGVTELYLDPSVASIEQVDRLAEVVL